MTGVVLPQLDHIRFHESNNLQRAKLIESLISFQLTRDVEYKTVRFSYNKANKIDPITPVNIFLGDDRHKHRLQGRAIVVRCQKVTWKVFGTNLDDLKNNIDGATKVAIEKILKDSYRIPVIDPKAEISIIHLVF